MVVRQRSSGFLDLCCCPCNKLQIALVMDSATTCLRHVKEQC